MQDSIWGGNGPANGNDENFNTVLGGKSCSVTNNVDRAWWGVDLKRPYRIDRVVLTNMNTASKSAYSLTHCG